MRLQTPRLADTNDTRFSDGLKDIVAFCIRDDPKLFLKKSGFSGMMCNSVVRSISGMCSLNFMRSIEFPSVGTFVADLLKCIQNKTLTNFSSDRPWICSPLLGFLCVRCSLFPFSPYRPPPLLRQVWEGCGQWYTEQQRLPSWYELHKRHHIWRSEPRKG